MEGSTLDVSNAETTAEYLAPLANSTPGKNFEIFTWSNYFTIDRELTFSAFFRNSMYFRMDEVASQSHVLQFTSCISMIRHTETNIQNKTCSIF